MWRWLILSAVVVVIDQWTKHEAVAALAGWPPLEVTAFFNLVLVYNTGAAFSFLAGAGGWQREFFIGIALVVSVWIIWLLHRHPRQTLFCAALALVLGGAIGNVIDRVLLGAVVDFLDFHAAGWHWPAFNVADSAITCGAALLIWDGLRPQAAAAPDKS
ncbi:MAG: lipoprotein signal peptidase [Betaproteobacteria bacterium]|nr:lipoprotein signal peptidase [Betaproteobacteria bacterium]